MFTCYCLSTSHFPISKHTLSFSLFKFKLLVSAPLSLSITLSFKPHFATSTNRQCHHSPLVGNISQCQADKINGVGGSSSVRRRKPVDLLGQVQYGRNSIFTPVWPKQSRYDHYLNRNKITTSLYQPTTGMENIGSTVRNRLPCIGHNNLYIY